MDFLTYQIQRILRSKHVQCEILNLCMKKEWLTSHFRAGFCVCNVVVSLCSHQVFCIIHLGHWGDYTEQPPKICWKLGLFALWWMWPYINEATVCPAVPTLCDDLTTDCGSNPVPVHMISGDKSSQRSPSFHYQLRELPGTIIFICDRDPAALPRSLAPPAVVIWAIQLHEC